jgi:glycosyltransferase involved in cell wall biosynthesis
VRTLVVTETFPWPVRSGNAMRIANVVGALAELGPVDLFALVDRARTEVCAVPAGAPVDRVEVAWRPRSRYGGLRRATWLATDSGPAELFGRDHDDVRRRLRRWAGVHYDLIWYERIGAHAAVAGEIAAPAIVDLDDLEDAKILDRLSSDGHVAPGSSRLQQSARAAREVVARTNARRWRDLQRIVAGAVEKVVVCSRADADRLGVPNAVVVSNGYDAPDVPLGRATVGQPPTLLFAGLLTYPPNVDAARHLVTDIVPELRTNLPDVVVHLAGKVDGRVRALHDPPGVLATGWADDMAVELARADVVVVPVRYSSGTRIKILEAFAHRIPVVSTGAGVAGLDAVDGEHLLVADAPGAFAEACHAALTDSALRARLVDAAHAFFLERYQWSTVRGSITALAADTVRRA